MTNVKQFVEPVCQFVPAFHVLMNKPIPIRIGLYEKPEADLIEHEQVILVCDDPIDLIPFGAIEGASSEIIWAHDGTKMSVAGFRSALATAIEAQVAPGLTVRCVDLCSLVFLKCRAYLDRWRSTTKDISTSG